MYVILTDLPLQRWLYERALLVKLYSCKLPILLIFETDGQRKTSEAQRFLYCVSDWSDRLDANTG
jgi:hypothetical protein